MIIKVCRDSRKIVLIVSAVLTMIFGITSIYAEYDATGSTSLIGQSLCKGQCLSHAQLVTSTTGVDSFKENDFEPSPPPFSWLQTPASIRLLYIAVAMLVFWLLEKQKQILLTTQLRI